MFLEYSRLRISFRSSPHEATPWSIAILCVSGFASLLRRIVVEDHALAERFGQEYLEYRKKTWALIPFVW